MLFASHSVLILHDIYKDASLSISDCINRASDVDWQRIIRLNEIDYLILVFHLVEYHHAKAFGCNCAEDGFIQ
jgi:hypothetical protein